MRTTKYITPKCCEKAKKTAVVRLGLYPIDTKTGEWKDKKPKWYVVGDTFFLNHNYNTKVEIEKCPFCDSILPDIEINNSIKKIAEGDEEYCDCCGERHMCCNCYPPEYRYKVKK